MITHLCDRCGRPLEAGELRYVARIQVYAAADPLTITEADLAQANPQAIAELVARCARLSEEELMRDVYVELKFDLCRRCQRVYLQNPLGGGGDAGT